VLIENGVCKGYAFFDLNYQLSNIEVFKNILIPVKPDKQHLQIIEQYLQKNKVIKIIEF